MWWVQVPGYLTLNHNHRVDLGNLKIFLFYLKKWALKILIPSPLEVKVTQACPTLCDPVDYTAHGILQATILEWIALPFSRGASQPRNQTALQAILYQLITFTIATPQIHASIISHLDYCNSLFTGPRAPILASFKHLSFKIQIGSCNAPPEVFKCPVSWFTTKRVSFNHLQDTHCMTHGSLSITLQAPWSAYSSFNISNSFILWTTVFAVIFSLNT